MSHNWIFDILGDMKSYAAQNGMSLLADQLDELRLTAAVEIASADSTMDAAPAEGCAGEPRVS